VRSGITFSDVVEVEVDVETEVEQEVDIVVVEVLEDDEVVDWVVLLLLGVEVVLVVDVELVVLAAELVVVELLLVGTELVVVCDELLVVAITEDDVVAWLTDEVVDASEDELAGLDGADSAT
jgi:hypothetical protein